jgi:hypothetical protein
VIGDDRQQETWSEAVRPFRSAVNALSNALPGWFGEILAADELLSELMVELPLVGFAPFAALPEGLPQRAHTLSPDMPRAAGRAPDLASEYPVPRERAQPAAPGRTDRIGGQQPPAPKAERKAGEQIPVFSLRGRQPVPGRGVEKGPPAGPGSGQERGAVPAEGSRPAGPGESGPSLPASPKAQAAAGEELPGATSRKMEDARRHPHAAATNGVEILSAAQGGQRRQAREEGPAAPASLSQRRPPQIPEGILPGEAEPWQPMPLLSQLADDALRRAGRAPAAPAEVQAAQWRSEPYAPYERPSPVAGQPAPARGGTPGPGRSADSEPAAGLEATRALPATRPGAQEASGTSPSFSSGDAERAARPAAVERLPGGDSVATLARINSLADDLLRSRYRSAGIVLQGRQNGVEVQDAERLFSGQERSAGVETGDRGGEQDEVAVPPLDALEGQGAMPGEQVDTETLAALINDILVEQARWHGVDLA